MRRKFVFSVLSLLMFAAVSLAGDNRFTLVVDAGHGGHDTGALGTISKEKDINLNVALTFGRYVERNCPDVRVIYTRKSDVFIPLMDRANIANRNKADLFISIHTNALPDGKTARGFETYTLGMHRAADNLDVAKRENAVILVEKDYQQKYLGFDPNSSESYIMFEFMQSKNMEKSVDLARYIQNNVCSIANRPDKGVYQAGFLVLRETSMPSCLIELGFITTPDEEQCLNTDSNVDAIARGIYQAFVQYKNKYDKGIVVPYKSEANTTPVIPDIVPDTYKEKPLPKRQQGGDKCEQSEPVAVADDANNLIFKIQIIASDRLIRANSSLFKGLDNVESYQENNFIKYTYGSSADYYEINVLRKQIQDKFPDAFIVAFKNGTKIDVNQGIREFKQNKNKNKK